MKKTTNKNKETSTEKSHRGIFMSAGASPYAEKGVRLFHPADTYKEGAMTESAEYHSKAEEYREGFIPPARCQKCGAVLSQDEFEENDGLCNECFTIESQEDFKDNDSNDHNRNR